MTIALETKNLEKSFGGLRVTRDLSLKVAQGARHALIGPNGAGKTTVINQLTGVLRPNGGRIVLHYLPKYAPETNPIERVWWHLHETITRNHRCGSIAELLNEVYTWADTHETFYLQTASFRDT